MRWILRMGTCGRDKEMIVVGEKRPDNGTVRMCCARAGGSCIWNQKSDEGIGGEGSNFETDSEPEHKSRRQWDKKKERSR